ncbi:SusC/RagA family TonB-linked outer membrane protein [Desertivirga brevis]|uniref:SusC/RagA family TonB-linked outer membrane protein n=1 Tax=Desertivirga brevis TaxID=2810310 RepID=UPI001F61AF8F|nr:SusC/RagA family TonB-linked outer membrane protein [Pedobacter sp. SYSU D00873]
MKIFKGMKSPFYKVFSLVIILGLSFCGVSLKAQAPQRITVKGKVIDSKDKLSVIGASVVELDKDKRIVRGATTDIDGNYALQISNPNNSIQVSYLGYKTQVQAINGRSVINISLVSNTSELADVVITGKRTVNNGTGLSIDERSSTFATTTVNAKDLQELSAASIDQALQGRMPGVDIGTTSGDPGAGMSIRIRGTASLNGSAEPMIVVDGMPFETNIPSDFNFSTADEQGYAQLLNIAPTDINTITILKDAASTAIWGARAANGVLLITTKRGVVGKPSIGYNFRGTYSKQPENIPLLSGDQYSTVILEAVNNRNGLPLNTTQNTEFLYDPMMPFQYHNYSQNSNWINAITQIGYSQDHNVTMQGGGEKARYYASAGYLNQVGTTKGTDLDRITTTINLDYNVSNRIRFRSDFKYTHVLNTLNYSGSVRNIAYTKMPNMGVYRYDEFGNQTPNYFSPASNIQGFYQGLNNRNEIIGTVNPLAMVEQSYARVYGERITPKFQLTYDILPNSLLVSTFDVQFDINNQKTKSFLPQIATGRPITETTVNRAADSDKDFFGVSTKLNFIFTPRLGENHSLQSLLTFQTEDQTVNEQNIVTSNTASSFLQDPSNPGRTQNADLALNGGISKYRTIGIATTQQYGYLDRYIINLTARIDGNSRFGSNYKYGIFPAVSARYRLSGEPFMKQFKFIDDFSFRASYGQSGGQPDKNYLFFNTYVPTASDYVGMSGVIPGRLGLDNLKWQTNIGRNFGLTFNALKNAIKLDIDIYSNRVKDMLFDRLQVPNYTGYTQLMANVGSMTNKGFEIGLNTTPYRSKQWIVNFGFNIAQNTNVITQISEFYPRVNGTSIGNGIYRSYLVEGNPFGSFYGFKYKGVYSDQNATIARDANGNQIIGPNNQVILMRYNYPTSNYVFQPGDAMYEDVNHDGNINQDDIVFLGNSIPKITGGFGPSITYKGNLTFNAFFSYKVGYKIVNNTLMNTTNMSGYSNQSTMVLQRWRNPGDVTNVPRALFQDGFNWLGSDRYVSDASFLRLKQVTVRYNLPKQKANMLRMKNASVYLTAENLATFTKYKGVDPDVASRGSNDPFRYNEDKALTPPTRNLLMGVTVGF